jgi:putative membrane protein
VSLPSTDSTIVSPDVKFHQILLAAVCAVFVWSAFRPHDYFTWFAEVLPVFIAAPIIFRTYRTFRLSTLLYTLIAIHAMVLMVGGHYTYAQVPLFNWIRDTFHLARNHYDRLGHFMQGFMPAILAREVLLRKTPLHRGGWLNYIVLSICLAFSAFYEFTEWWTALIMGSAANDFLGTQGDPWDTQWDMFMCLIGASTALLTMPKLHDISMKKLLEATNERI